VSVAATPSEAEPRAAASRLAPDRSAEPACSQRQRLRHDIQHELATISLLASLIDTSEDIGESSRARSTQLVRETRWLAELLQAYEDVPADTARPSPDTERLRVDIVAGEVVAALRLTHCTTVSFEAAEAWTHANPLDLWRVLRNVLENAFRAAGPHGRVRVRVATEDGAAVVQVDEDGPGLGAGPPGLASQGLGIVRDLLDLHRGRLLMANSDLGGGSVRVQVPAAPAPEVVKGWFGEDVRASTRL
jgi:signal transduction histidine kinase